MIPTIGDGLKDAPHYRRQLSTPGNILDYNVRVFIVTKSFLSRDTKTKSWYRYDVVTDDEAVIRSSIVHISWCILRYVTWMTSVRRTIITITCLLFILLHEMQVNETWNAIVIVHDASDMCWGTNGVSPPTMVSILHRITTILVCVRMTMTSLNDHHARAWLY